MISDNELTANGNNSLGYNADSTHVTVPEGTEIIRRWSFFRWNLETITIPPGVKIIEDDAFGQCKNLTSISLPDIEKIGHNAFSGCSSLKKTEIGPNLSELGWDAFKGCASLEEVSIPEKVKSIGASAFKDCKSLKKVELSEGLEDIQVNAFRGCKNIQRIVIPNSVTSIEGGAFSGCDELNRDNVILPETLSSKTVSGVLMNFGLDEEIDYLTYIGVSDENHCLVFDDTLIQYDGEGDIAHITEGVTSIRQDAFLFNGLEGKPKKVILPNTIRNIEQWALDGIEIEAEQSLFKTNNKLPGDVAAGLGDDLEAVAYSVLFQSGKKWAKAISEVLPEVGPNDIFRTIVDILAKEKDSASNAVASRAVTFAADNKAGINGEYIALLEEVLRTEEKKWKKAIQSFEIELGAAANEDNSKKKPTSSETKKKETVKDNPVKEEPYVFPSDENEIINNAVELYVRIYKELSQKVEPSEATVIDVPECSSSYAGKNLTETFFRRLADYISDKAAYELYDNLTPNELYRSWTKDYGPGLGQVGLALALGQTVAEYALCENSTTGNLVFCRDKWEYRGDYSSRTRPALHIDPNLNKWKVFSKKGYPYFEM